MPAVEWAGVLRGKARWRGIKGVFGCKEVGGSKEMGKYNCSLPYLSKHRKRKIRKLIFLFSSLFYTTIFSLSECYS